MYHLAMFTEAKLISKAVFNTYSEANEVIESYWEKYPNSWIEIVTDAELRAANK